MTRSQRFTSQFRGRRAWIAQAKDDDKHYAEQARKRREAEAAAQQNDPAAVEHDHSEGGHHD